MSAEGNLIVHQIAAPEGSATEHGMQITGTPVYKKNKLVGVRYGEHGKIFPVA